MSDVEHLLPVQSQLGEGTTFTVFLPKKAFTLPGP